MGLLNLRQEMIREASEEESLTGAIITVVLLGMALATVALNRRQIKNKNTVQREVREVLLISY